MEKVDEKSIKETVGILKQLDERSLLLINSGAKLLAARKSMEEGQQEEGQQEGER